MGSFHVHMEVLCIASLSLDKKKSTEIRLSDSFHFHVLGLPWLHRRLYPIFRRRHRTFLLVPLAITPGT